MSPTSHLHHGGLIQGKIERKKKKQKEVREKEREERLDRSEEDEEGDEKGGKSLKWRGDETMKRERGRYSFSRE